MAKLELISEWFIRPNCEIEQSMKQQKPHHYHLSPPDFFRLSVDYAHHGLLFAKPNPSSSSFTYEDEHSCCIFVDCNKGTGARLIHATTPKITIMDVHAPSGDVPLFVQLFFDLGERAINYDGHTRPLLTVQVTELVDGVFMGFTTNHCVIDGTSFFHFFHVWSEIFTRYRYDGVIVPLSPLPNYERSPILEGYGPTIKLPYLDPHELKITRVVNNRNGLLHPVRERIFHFSAASMAMLKAKAKAELCDDDNTSISSYQSLCALVWRSITRARNLHLEEETTCAFSLNIRPRFDPPLSNNYFGNYLTVAKGTAKVGELLERSLGWAAMLLHQSIAAVDDKVARDVFIRPFLKGTCPILGSPGYVSYGPNPVVIGGSAKFDPYGLEFGLGRAVAVRIGTSYESEGLIVTYPGCEGGGSVELTIRLVSHTMAALLSDEEFMSFVSWSPKL